jgi:hypothetical protein
VRVHGCQWQKAVQLAGGGNATRGADHYPTSCHAQDSRHYAQTSERWLASACGPSGAATRTTRGVDAADALWSAQGVNCFNLACFDRVFLTIFQLKCTLR